MVQQPTPVADVKPELASGTQNTQQETGTSTAPVGGDLPDLSRLSLGTGHGARVGEEVGQEVGRGAPTGAVVLPGLNVHISVHSGGGPVTINVIPGGHPEPGRGAEGRTAHATAGTVSRSANTAAPGRIRLSAPLVATAVATAGTAAAPGVQQAPATPAEGCASGVAAGTAPGSPRIEAATATPEVAPAAEVGEYDDYEYIAPRDESHTRWYVVTAGRRVGIWREWLDMSNYVTRVSGNQHKSFDSRAEAEAHYYSNKDAGNVEIILP